MKENIAFQSLYKPDATNFSDEKLETYSRSAYNTFIRCYNEDHYKNLCNITKQQSLSQAWYIHRAGRITASNSKMAFEIKVESSQKGFLINLFSMAVFLVFLLHDMENIRNRLPENLSQNISVNIMSMS